MSARDRLVGQIDLIAEHAIDDSRTISGLTLDELREIVTALRAAEDKIEIEIVERAKAPAVSGGILALLTLPKDDGGGAA